MKHFRRAAATAALLSLLVAGCSHPVEKLGGTGYTADEAATLIAKTCHIDANHVIFSDGPVDEHTYHWSNDIPGNPLHGWVSWNYASCEGAITPPPELYGR